MSTGVLKDTFVGWTRAGYTQLGTTSKKVATVPANYHEMLIVLYFWEAATTSMLLPYGIKPRNMIGKVETKSTTLIQVSMNSSNEIWSYVLEGFNEGQILHVFYR